MPLTLLPPITSDRDRLTLPTHADEDGDEGFTVNVADCVFADDALIVAAFADDTVEVETGKLAVVCPAGIVTEAGTVAAELLLVSPTCTPPDGAAAASVTAPVAFCPPVTDDGEMERLAMVALVGGGLLTVGLIWRLAEAPLADDAFTVAVVGVVTAEVATGNVPLVCP